MQPGAQGLFNHHVSSCLRPIGLPPLGIPQPYLYCVLKRPGPSSNSSQEQSMKSMWPPLAAIFFMAYFYRAMGLWPLAPWIRY